MHPKITVHAPATVANVVCGFDVLGFALAEPYDTLHISLSDTAGVRIRNLDTFELPTDPTRNCAGGALLAMLREVDEPIGFEVESAKAIKPGSGIGSSAASAAAAVVGANRLLGDRFGRADLVRFATFGEEIASGARHADNIAPCIYGGFTLIRSNTPLDIVPLPYPMLWVTVVHPQIEIRTADARRLLKSEIPLADAITQWGNVGGLVAGLMLPDYDLIARSLHDVVAEPYRRVLIPHFDAVKHASMAAGALGGGISGSGPSIFMLSRTEHTAMAVGEAMRSVYALSGIGFHIHVTTISANGATVQ